MNKILLSKYVLKGVTFLLFWGNISIPIEEYIPFVPQTVVKSEKDRSLVKVL